MRHVAVLKRESRPKGRLQIVGCSSGTAYRIPDPVSIFKKTVAGLAPREAAMQRVLMAVAVGALMGAGPTWAQQEDMGRKLMTAATITLAAYLQQGGTIDIQSADSALLERYRLKAWKDADCVYSIAAGQSVTSRQYTIDFHNLTGGYQIYGAQVVFYGNGKAPICFKETNGSGLCFKHLAIDRPSRPDGIVNDVLFVIKNACPPIEENQPGNRDPY